MKKFVLFMAIAILLSGCAGRKIMSPVQAFAPIEIPAVKDGESYQVLMLTGNKAHAIASSVGPGQFIGVKDGEDDKALPKANMFGNLVYMDGNPFIIAMNTEYRIKPADKVVVLSRINGVYQMSPDGKYIYGENHEKFSWENIKTIAEYQAENTVWLLDVKPGSEWDVKFREFRAKIADRSEKMRIPTDGERIAEKTAYISKTDVAANILLPGVGAAVSVGTRAVDIYSVMSGDADVELSINEKKPMSRMEIAEALSKQEEERRALQKPYLDKYEAVCEETLQMNRAIFKKQMELLESRKKSRP